MLRDGQSFEFGRLACTCTSDVIVMKTCIMVLLIRDFKAAFPVYFRFFS